MEVKKGTVNRSEYFYLRDSTTGDPKTGLLYNSAGAVASYMRSGGLRVDIPLVAMDGDPSPDDVHVDGGFIEVDGTDMKGIYRLCALDAAYVTGVDEVIFSLAFDGVSSEPLRVTLVDNSKKDIYDRIGAPAGASLSADIVAHEVARSTMETGLTAEHDTTQTAIAEITTTSVNILSATGYVKNIYWASGGKYFVKESEDIDIPFGFEGNPTGLELWFVISKDLKNAPLIKKELIEGVDWNVVDVDGVDTVEGIIPFAYADTDTLHGKYTAAAIVKTSETEAYTGWESLLIVDRPVARAEDLV